MGRSKKIVLDIDIGGTTTRYSQGSAFRKFKTPKKKGEFVSLLKTFPKAESIEIGAAGVIEGTRVKKSPNIKYLKNFDFLNIFPNARLSVDNDARFFLKKRLGKFGRKRILALIIGTGIGRAYGERGKVLKIKSLEYPEKWEKEYQKIRDKKDYKKLAGFLGKKFSVLTKKYRPDAVILGGGVLRKKGFYKMLKDKVKIKTYV